LRTTFGVTRRGNQVTVTSRTSGKGFPEFRRTRLRFKLVGFGGDHLELDGLQVRVHDSQFECENRGEACSFSFSL
jgi:hypothetical protein